MPEQCGQILIATALATATAFGPWTGSAEARPRDSILTDAGWIEQLKRRGLDPNVVARPVAFTREMQELAQAVAAAPQPLERLRRLQVYLFDRGRFPFDYDSRETYTAIEAFERRSGNCVSFTNLFIALSRSLGVPVRAALPAVRGDVEREGNLVVVNDHVVAVYRTNAGFEVFDFSTHRQRQLLGLRPIDDLWIAAIYLNNLGAQALIRGEPDAALTRLEAAVTLAPEFAPAQGNLGVVRRNLGDIPGALEAYREALSVDPRDSAVLHNLATLYRSQGRSAEARIAIAAARPRHATPYLLILRGDFERTDGRYRRALRYYRRAARYAPDLPDPLLAVAHTQRARGRVAAACKAVRRALSIDPDSTEGNALLQRLVASDSCR